MGKYLDSTGLQVLWNKIKSVFLPKSGGTITGNLTVQGTSGIDCEYNVQASGFVHTNPTNTNDMLLANGNTLPQSTFSLSGYALSNDDGKAIAKAIAEAVARAQEAYTYTDTLRNQFDAHTHPYLPISGGTVTGNLAIGTSSTYKNLTVHGNISCHKLYVNDIIGNSEDNIYIGTMNNSGRIYLTDDIEGSEWSVTSGHITCTGVSQSSDKRLKENIHDVDKSFTEKYWATEHGLIHEYDWIKSGKHANGMIAQELLNYIPEAVNHNVENDTYSVDYTSATCKIMGAMFQKIKELESEIVTFKQEIEKLKNN